MEIPLNLEKNEEGKTSFYHIFYSPLDKIYNAFIIPELHSTVFFQKVKINSMKKETTLDSPGNEIIFFLEEKYEYKCIVKDVINLPFYKSLTFQSITHPPETTEFCNTYCFMWDDINKFSVFKFIGEKKESSSLNLFLNYIMDNKITICHNIEKYLMKVLVNIEENESIVIKRSIKDTWNYLIETDKSHIILKTCYDVQIEKKDENFLEIFDKGKKNSSLFSITKNCEKDDIKYCTFCTISTSPKFPRQKIEIIFIKLNENETVLVFKHIALEYIPYNILMSYSCPKKKYLKVIKKAVESNNSS